MGPPTYIFYFIKRANFEQLQRTCLYFFSFSLRLKYLLQGILDISIFTVDTHDAHALRLITSRMQFSIRFAIQSLEFHCCGITFICRILVASLNSKRFHYEQNYTMDVC
jgi:hypothetical protein